MSKAKKIIIFIVLIAILVIPFGITSSAVTGDVYTVPFNTPASGANNGYLEILYQDTNGNKNVCVLSWYTNYDYLTSGTGAYSDNCSIDVNVIVKSNGVTIYPYGTPDYYTCYMDYIAVESSGYYSCGTLQFGKGYENNSFTLYSGYSILSVKGYGNCHLQGSAAGGPTAFSVLYSEDAPEYNQLLSTVSLLRQMAGNDTTIINTLNSILSSTNSVNDKLTQVIALLTEVTKTMTQKITDNADKNASDIQKNDDENTQAIIDNQNDLAEKEKTETQNQGEGSVNDVSGAIEDKSSGFISSIGNLVSAMSYNGTSCAWKFPSLKLPAIDGVMSEIKLTDEKPIDFEYWVNKIPSNVLLLVRSVLTIALIGYCFKELYNTISYVLTLKGGGNDE